MAAAAAAQDAVSGTGDERVAALGGLELHHREALVVRAQRFGALATVADEGEEFHAFRLELDGSPVCEAGHSGADVYSPARDAAQP